MKYPILGLRNQREMSGARAAVSRQVLPSGLRDGGAHTPVARQDLSLGVMVSISRTLASLVQDLLGPGGQQTLLSTATGKVKVTRDGLTILSSLHLDHPVAHLIVRSLRACCLLHGDGGKTFVLYLSQLLKDIADRMDRESGPNAALSRVKLSLELNKFLCNDFPHIADLVLQKVKASAVRKGGHDDASVVKNVIKSSLRTCLQAQFVPFFTDFLSAFLSLENSVPYGFQSQLDNILQHFDMYCSKVTTLPPQKSMVCKGVLLEANLQTVSQSQIEAGTMVSKKFAMMDVTWEEPENGGEQNTVSIRLTSNKVEDLLFHKRSSVERILKALKAVGVQVLLCSDTAPEFVKGLCRENSIILQCLPQERLSFLKDVTGAPILTNLAEAVPTKCFFVGKVSSFVQMGKKVCTMIELMEDSVVLSLPLKHLVVCSPTEGLCDQLCQALHKAVKTVAQCWTSSFGESSPTPCVHQEHQTGVRNMLTNSVGEVGSVHFQQANQSLEHRNLSSEQAHPKALATVSCGGAFEAVLTSSVIEYYISRNLQPAEQIDTLIRKMLLSVPRTLHNNLCMAKNGQQRQFIEKWTRLLSMARSDQGFGDHSDLVKHEYIEPVGVKLATVAGVLQLVAQLLRVEAVVSVQKPLSSALSADDGNDDDDVD